MLRPFLLICLLLPSPALAAPGAATYGYDVYVGGLKLGRMTLQTQVQGDAYTLAVGARPGDLLARLINWSYVAEAGGRFGGPAGVQPQRFHSERTLRGKSHTQDMAYAPDGTVTTSHVPAQSAEDEAAVPPDQRAGTVDLLSAAAAISRAVEAKDGRCEVRVPVYDGRRRYDVEARPLKPRSIEKSDYTAYEGQAIGCRVLVHPVAGFRQAKRNEQNFWTIAPDGKPRGFDLWLGRPAPGDPLVPVRLEAKELFYADVIGHLAAVDRPE
ncbi:DUF3108 domain-containing protein [Aerophototrophica crusticola]|uniref:DUF3108 domain-containing protein n=1 Tax=Aerophototrophica crusticola TaxID=1709002 RepID=A0A858R3X9_9PROT|nr:DUF3108 domain-containing protein [Rhodospirillaceae bacterium B3]